MVTPEEKKKKQKKVKRELAQNGEKLKHTEDDVTRNIKLSGKKKRIRVKDNNVQVEDALHVTNTAAVSKPTKVGVEPKENKLSRKKKRKTGHLIGSPAQPEAVIEDDLEAKKGKTNKSGKKSSKKKKKAPERNGDVEADDVYHISSSDGDFSKGMKKWIMEYHERRPGLKVLQERIDDFMTAHEDKLEQEREQKLANAAEGGWTVVVHHKGRKKTTDAESGIAVGSVARAAVEDKMSKKKSKEIGLDFYRFQRREAQKNEIVMLRNKFEEDRKRIQQLRAERKFRPY